MIQQSRRLFLAGLGTSLIAAPAIVRASSLMPIKAEKAFVLELASEGGMLDYSSFEAGLLRAVAKSVGVPYPLLMQGVRDADIVIPHPLFRSRRFICPVKE